MDFLQEVPLPVPIHLVRLGQALQGGSVSRGNFRVERVRVGEGSFVQQTFHEQGSRHKAGVLTASQSMHGGAVSKRISRPSLRQGTCAVTGYCLPGLPLSAIFASLSGHNRVACSGRWEKENFSASGQSPFSSFSIF